MAKLRILFCTTTILGLALSGLQPVSAQNSPNTPNISAPNISATRTDFSMRAPNALRDGDTSNPHSVDAPRKKKDANKRPGQQYFQDENLASRHARTQRALKDWTKSGKKGSRGGDSAASRKAGAGTTVVNTTPASGGASGETSSAVRANAPPQTRSRDRSGADAEGGAAAGAPNSTPSLDGPNTPGVQDGSNNMPNFTPSMGGISSQQPHFSTRGAESANRDFNDLFLRFISSVASLDRQANVDVLLRPHSPVSLDRPSVRRAARDLAATSSLHPTGKAAGAEQSRNKANP